MEDNLSGFIAIAVILLIVYAVFKVVSGILRLIFRVFFSSKPSEQEVQAPTRPVFIPGHVYIISNARSFGPDVFKIGMTERYDPFDRIKELNNASVPFPFDVHAILPAQDPRGLEKHLHSVFSECRVNRENPRKEFFRASMSEMELQVKRVAPEVHFRPQQTI